MKTTLIAGLMAATALMTPFAATAETLAFGTGNSAEAPVVRMIFTPWAERVNAQGGDALNIEMRHGRMIITPDNFVDRLIDDVVQITWGLAVYQPGNFPRSLVSTMPLMTESSAAAAMAFCRLYENGDFGAEWENYIPLLYVPFPQVGAHLNGEPLTSMEDLAGMKIMTGSPIAAGIVQAYGGTPLSIQLPEQYQALQRGTADGTFMSWTAFPAFNLQEVTTDHLIAPLGGATGIAFMSRARFEALSPEAQEVLRANSGCDEAARTGAIVDGWENGARDRVAAMDGHTITTLSSEGLAELSDRVMANVIAGFDSRVPGGADLIAAWQAAVAQAAIDAPEILAQER